MRVRAGEYETVHSNMPATGLGRLTELMPIEESAMIVQDLPLPVLAQENTDVLTFRRSKQLLQVCAILSSKLQIFICFRTACCTVMTMFAGLLPCTSLVVGPPDFESTGCKGLRQSAALGIQDGLSCPALTVTVSSLGQFQQALMLTEWTQKSAKKCCCWPAVLFCNPKTSRLQQLLSDFQPHRRPSLYLPRCILCLHCTSCRTRCLTHT